jgi:acyl-CoA dehydrogenase
MNPNALGVPKVPARVTLPPTGLEAPLTPMQAQLVDGVRRFADEVLRPTGLVLDRMSPEAVVAPESPLWTVFARSADLGLSVPALAQLPADDLAVLLPLFWEELGRGDAGLAISLGVAMLPALMLASWGRLDLLARIGESAIGCWGITEPDHGSDSLDADRRVFDPRGEYGRPNCLATRRDGHLVLNGQKAAWVSNGGIAQVCLLYTAFDRGRGPREGAVLLVPLDRPGVSRGRPLDKLGQRALNQAEIFFDDVVVEEELLVVGPEQYGDAVYSVLAEANAGMGALFTGVAQAAYDAALAYAHQRRQGGVPIIVHQSVRQRLFHMFRRVEAARALARRVFRYNGTAAIPALQGSIAAKVTATQTAFDVASDALQIFGGNGLSRDYPIEKLLRDARASMIEDGCNEMLAIKGGSYLLDPEALRPQGDGHEGREAHA